MNSPISPHTVWNSPRTIYSYIIYSTIIYPTTISNRNTSRATAKTETNPIFSIGTVFRIGFFRREIVTQPVAARQQAKKKHIGVDNRYDYTLHATQDDQHHDNARTN